MSKAFVKDGMVLVIGGDTAILNQIEPGSKTPTAPKDPIDLQKDWVANYGLSNDYPEEVLDKIKKVSLIKPILDWKIRIASGNGLVYGRQKYVGTEKVFEPIIDPEIDDWMEQTDIMLYTQEALSNFYYFHNVFPEIITSINGKKINFLTCNETTETRFAIREQKGKLKGQITKTYITADWKNVASKDTVDFNLDNIITWLDPVEQVRAKKDSRFSYPVYFPSPGRPYYQDAPWHVILDSWLPVAMQVPVFKKSLLENSASIKYLIHVPEWYWGGKYKDWDKKSNEEQVQIVTSEKQAFDKFLKEKQGGSMMVTSKNEMQGQVKYKDWKIEAVDDKLKDGRYIEDSQEADHHIFRNLNVDPTLFGAGPGKGQGSSGSGSDKRVAANSYVMSIKPHQDLVLKPLNFIARYNGWAEKHAKDNSRFMFMFENQFIARLDEGVAVKPAEDYDPNKN